MQALFSSPTLATLSVLVILAELLSVAVLCVAVFAYRNLVLSRHEFLSSLHHGEKYAKKRTLGILPWAYIAVTVAIVLLTLLLAVWQPRFL